MRGLRSAILLAVTTTMSVSGGCSSTARLMPADEPLLLDSIPITYSHRREFTTFAISAEQWREICAYFDPQLSGGTPREERLAIRKAIARIEQIAATQTPTFRDWRMDDINPAGMGCLDCIDEAINCTTYLRLLEERGLLRHHHVMEKAFRGPLSLDTHYAGQVQELASGEFYIVDSWFLANGWPPHVQKTSDWLAREDWPREENPETFDEDALDHSKAYWPKTE